MRLSGQFQAGFFLRKGLQRTKGIKLQMFFPFLEVFMRQKLLSLFFSVRLIVFL